jgi:hypothetical protein
MRLAAVVATVTAALDAELVGELLLGQVRPPGLLAVHLSNPAQSLAKGLQVRAGFAL